MKAKLTLTLEGRFPGSPEKDSMDISLEEYDKLWQTWIKPKAIKEGRVGELPTRVAERKQKDALKQSKELIELQQFNDKKEKTMRKVGLIQ
jgi:hypothetical protein